MRHSLGGLLLTLTGLDRFVAASYGAQQQGNLQVEQAMVAYDQLVYGEPYLEAHHSPDVFPGQHELVKAVSGPMATKARAAHKAIPEAQEQRERRHPNPQNAGDEPEKRRPGRPPKAPVRLEQAAQALEAARREPQRLAQQRAQGTASLRGIGHDDHFVDLERGVRRTGQLIAADIHEHIAQMRTMAQHAGLSQRGVERLDKAARVVPKRPATSEFVSGYVRPPVARLDWTPPVSFARHAKLIPSSYLDRVAQTRSVSDGAPLRALAERLRTPVVCTRWRLARVEPGDSRPPP